MTLTPSSTPDDKSSTIQITPDDINRSTRRYGRRRPAHFFLEIASLVRLGHRRRITCSNLAPLSETNTTRDAADRIHVHYLKSDTASHYRIYWSMFAIFKKDYIFSGICDLARVYFDVVAAFVLRFVIAQADGTPDGTRRAIGAVIGVFALLILSAAADSHAQHLKLRIAQNIRATLTLIIHHKNLRLTPRARAETRIDAGHVNSMIQTDTERMAMTVERIHYPWTTPLLLLLVLTLLSVNITYSALPGLALIVCLVMPFAFLCERRAQVLSKRADEIVTARSSLIATILNGIKFVKLHVWEHAFAKQLYDLRAAESNLIVRTMKYNTSFFALIRGVASFSPMLCLVVYVLTGHTLEASITFSSLAMLSACTYPLCFFSLGLRDLGVAKLSHDRIQNFLDLPENDSIEDLLQVEGDHSVILNRASFTWESSAFTLNDLSCLLSPGITAVVGDVGSGKSSLLSALAGEMRMTAGSLDMPGRPAYCAQDNWVRSATLRENITFGAPFDSTRYEAVLDDCALRSDIGTLPHGDLTEIGEKGVMLSGGQKLRINLARALYADRQVLLIDDPLAAVDAPIGSHIFSQAICGARTQGKIVIMATHQLRILQSCDYILWLTKGTYVHGSFTDMMGNPEFANFVGSHRQVDHETAETAVEHAHHPSSHQLQDDEDSQTDSVRLKTVLTFITGGGNLPLTMFVYATCFLAEGIVILTDVWLAWWVDDRFGWSTSQYVGSLLALSAMVGVIAVAWGFVSIRAAALANLELFVRALASVLRAPVAWFDTQPTGRILSRFTHDVMVMDRAGTIAFKSLAQDLALVVGILVLTVVYYPWFALALVPLYIGLAYLLVFTHRTTRELRRLCTLKRNDAASLIHEASEGHKVLRQYDQLEMFDEAIETAVESWTMTRGLENGTTVWVLSIFYAANTLLVLVAGILVVFSRQVSVPPGTRGVILSTVLSIMHLTRRICANYALFEDSLHGCERLQYYADSLPQEHTSESDPDPAWPQAGAITVSKLSLRYGSGPYVLSNLDFSIKPNRLRQIELLDGSVPHRGA